MYKSYKNKYITGNPVDFSRQNMNSPGFPFGDMENLFPDVDSLPKM